MLQAGFLLFTASTQAQTPACEQLKGVLAQRLPADVRGYSLEAVPAKTPLPFGAKIIGTCEGAAYKIVYRRWGGGAVASRGAASAAGPDSGPKAAAVPTPAPAVPTQAAKPTPRAQAERPKPPPASVPAATPLPVTPFVVATPEPAPSIAPPASAPLVQRDEASAPKAPSVLGFMLEHWRWGLAMILLLAVGLVWYAYRSMYDEAGLPRGPKL